MAALLFFFFPQGTLTTGSATPGNEGKSRSSALGTAGVGEETVRALELLSLFEHLEPDVEPVVDRVDLMCDGATSCDRIPGS